MHNADPPCGIFCMGKRDKEDPHPPFHRAEGAATSGAQGGAAKGLAGRSKQGQADSVNSEQILK